jgi:signal transduction histidine kinase
LALVVALPLLAVALLTLPGVLGAINRAQRVDDIGESMQVANRVTSLVSELRQERLLSLGYLFGLVDRSRLVSQSTRVSDRIVDIRHETRIGELAGGRLSEPVTAALGGAEALADLRGPVLEREAGPDQVMANFGAVVEQLIDSLQLVDQLDLATPAARQVAALEAALRSNEAASQATDMLLLVVATGSPEAATRYLAMLQLLDDHLSRFAQFASADQIALVTLMEGAYVAREATGEGVAFTPDVGATAAQQSPASVFPALESLGQLGRFVEKKVITDVLIEVEAAGASELRTAYLVAAGAVLVVLVVVALTTILARAVVRPLIGLTSSAHRVARVAEAELARIADDESYAGESVRLEPVQVESRDEIGDLGRAFDRVQATAVRLVERQTAIRRNVALMFGYLGRRTQNLVSRQLALIDQLERDEAYPSPLADLYRLDHVSSRLRRNAGSLVVLSGATGADEHVAPLPLADLVRLALGEIEDYRRVDVEVPAGIMLAPAVVGDLVLVLAELMENATAFSPPHTRVSVSAMITGAGAELAIVDRGIGMSPHRMAEENARLARRERLDLAPTEVLGLFVVGRLARRHGLWVTLAPTPGGGVTATIGIDRRLLVQTDRLAPVPSSYARVLATVAAPNGVGSATAGAERTLARTGPANLEPSLVDLVALGRASRTLAAVRPWNAFALPPARPGPGGTRPGNQSSALRRRVPGATLRSLAGPSATAAQRRRSARAAAEPERVRDLVEQLESGVARALSEIRSTDAVVSAGGEPEGRKPAGEGRGPGGREPEGKEPDGREPEARGQQHDD